ncbi:MAG: HAMP domain-containing histidine kinase [Lachnospiraceae bacterium]|nr:HAMP domain-containing histidine kinase [Lachnospiraceae bacterium]
MHFRLNITAKLIISYVISLIFLIFGWSVFGTRFFEHKLIKDTNSTFYNSLSGVADNYKKGYYNNLLNSADLSIELDIISDYLDSRILLAKSDGTMIYDSHGSSYVNLFSYDNDILSDLYSYNVRLPGFIDEPFLSVSYPITYDMKLRGHIVMIKYCSDIFDEADAINASYWPYITAASLLVTLIYIYLYIRILLPLKKISYAAKEYSNKNFSYECSFRAGEFSELYNAINCIANDLDSLEDEQRKFISNISHDFRSPLTSIRGYTEAMIDGTISPEMNKKYLKIILFETERLAKLTTSLLEINNMDSRATSLDLSSFDINTTIKQSVECFEGSCKEKLLHVKLVFEEPNTYVVADLGKIQQVLYNLIDNAIKFSHNNSDIIISTTIRNEKIFISVKDSGIGIPKECISKIWDRFYKTDVSRGKDKKGTGLGLSIVKEIINAHNENINVTSTLDVGTEFTFSLPRKSM